MNNLEMSLKVAVGTVFHYGAKTHLAHFNITGPRFYELHILLDKIYKDLEDNFDGIGEQLRALDIFAPIGVAELLNLSVLEDFQEILSANEMIHELLLDNDKLLEVLNEVDTLAANHIGLQNYIEGLADMMNKYGWFLRATIQTVK
jgi:starvation-inducible DNA-binding protein